LNRSISSSVVTYGGTCIRCGMSSGGITTMTRSVRLGRALQQQRPLDRMRRARRPRGPMWGWCVRGLRLAKFNFASKGP
jgi:hypothetical protein